MHKTKRSPFTSQENTFIRESVKRIGEDWESIAKKLPGRTPKQVHDRYINYLRDGLINSPWTKQEDDILMLMYKAIGPKWTKMMINLPGRSGNDIKNRWHKHLAKKNLHFNEPDKSDQPTASDLLIVPKEPTLQEVNPIGSLPNTPIINTLNSTILPNNHKIACSASLPQYFGLIEPMVKTSQGQEITLQQKVHSDFVDFNVDKNVAPIYNYNIPKYNPEYLYQNDNQMINDAQKSVKIINKFDIGLNEKVSTDYIQGDQTIDLKPTFVKPDFDIQEILEDINSENLDFPWLWN